MASKNKHVRHQITLPSHHCPIALNAYMNIEPASVTKDIFLIKSGSFDALNVNQNGVVNFGGFSTEPSVVEGGLYYNTDENEFYLGTG